MNNTVTIKGTVRQEVKDRLAEIARQQGRAADDELVAKAVEAYVATYDRDAKLIQEALDEARAGGPFIDGEEMEAWSKSLATDNPLPRPKAAIFTRSGERFPSGPERLKRASITFVATSLRSDTSRQRPRG